MTVLETRVGSIANCYLWVICRNRYAR